MQITDGKLICVKCSDIGHSRGITIPEEVSVITTGAFQKVKGSLRSITVSNPNATIQDNAFMSLNLKELSLYDTNEFQGNPFLNVGSTNFSITIEYTGEEPNLEYLKTLQHRIASLVPQPNEITLYFCNHNLNNIIQLNADQSVLPSNNDSTDNHSPHNINTNLIASIILGVSLTAIGIGVAALTFFIALNTVALAFGVGIGICVAVWGLGYLGKGIKEQLFDAPPDLALSAS